MQSLEILPFETNWKSQSVVHGTLYIGKDKYEVPTTGVKLTFKEPVDVKSLSSSSFYMHLHAYDRTEADNSYFLINSCLPRVNKQGHAIMEIHEGYPAVCFHIVNKC